MGTRLVVEKEVMVASEHTGILWKRFTWFRKMTELVGRQEHLIWGDREWRRIGSTGAEIATLGNEMC